MLPVSMRPWGRHAEPVSVDAHIVPWYLIAVIEFSISLSVMCPPNRQRLGLRMALENPFLQTADDISFFCHGDGAFPKFDLGACNMVTDFIREHTGVTMDVAFVGRGNFFQLWEPKRLRIYAAEARTRLMKLR